MSHHAPFEALGPLSHSTLSNETLSSLLTTTFSFATTLIDSIPSPLSTPHHQSSATRARSSTTPSPAPSSLPTLSPEALALQKEWKHVKVAAKENPLGISVFKMSAKDGGGAWFARRSVHRGVRFEKWVMGLRREFAETSTVRSGASGSVRGLGAERRLGRVGVDGVGGGEVFLVSVRFPGPTTPRDFVTVVLTPEGEGDKGADGERRFMLVSRPCEYEGCPPREGFVRGTYESVEMVREVRRRKGLRRTRSAETNTRMSGEALSREAVLRAAREREGRKIEFEDEKEARTAASSPGPHGEDEEEIEIEWLMVTRSDPGGSVPRFMVEKGTPGGIINDAGRFLNWITHKQEEDLRAAMEAGPDELDQDETGSLEEAKLELDGAAPTPKPTERTATDESDKTITEEIAPPTGFYGMIASALEAAGSIVLSRVSSIAGSAATDSDFDDDESDTTSELGYVSAEEGDSLAQSAVDDVKESPSILDLESSTRSIHSTTSSGSQIPADLQDDKELIKLQERQRRAHEKMVKMEEKLAAKRHNKKSDKDKESQEAALTKLREKHEKEMAKQEEKYQRDVEKLQEKRVNERRKAEARRRKAEEREERRNLHAELEKVRTERNTAMREIEILKEQVGALQAQNTMLVARLGKESSTTSLTSTKSVSGKA